MEILLKEIDRENWVECTDLNVSKKQEEYVDSNWYSILLSKFEEECYPFCIYDGEVMVGFIMYDQDPETKRMEMSKLMIDKKYQGKGYGKKAILTTLDLIREKYGEIKFYTSIEHHNTVAQKLYESLGFIKTGEIMWGEDVMEVQL